MSDDLGVANEVAKFNEQPAEQIEQAAREAQQLEQAASQQVKSDAVQQICQLAPQQPKATRITKLVLEGFKSFGKRTELLFNNEFNIILGPNGSGKSNISEALCFVLGRSSAKSLRAERASSFIYNGGKTKQPAKQAEVSVFFDNSNWVFPVAEDEVKITRIVKQDGQSKYKINGKTRTRQELLELLSAAKIDPNGYNLVMQGDIVHFVEMSTVERRQIIEDIAGIGIYEEKKEQSLKNLAVVEEKLGHAEIIWRERDMQLRELKKDRDHALKYKTLNDQIKQNKATYSKKQLDKKQSEADKLGSKSGKFKQKLEKLNAQLLTLRTDISEKKKRVSEIAAEIETKGETEQVALQKEIEQLKVDLASARTRASSCTAELARMEQRKQQIGASFEDSEQKKKELEESKSEFVARQAAIVEQLEQIAASMARFKQKHGLPEGTEQIESEIEAFDKKAEEKQQEVQQLREKQQSLLREKDKIDFQLQTIDSQIDKVLELEKAHKNEIEQLKQGKNELKDMVLELNKLLNEDSRLAAELVQLRAGLLAAREEFEKAKIRGAAVQEGLAHSTAVKAIIGNKNKDELGKIFGTIAELGQVESEYSLALETAAGAKMQSIVVDNDKTAANCIKYLKQNKLGTATFFPLNKVKPAAPEESAKKIVEAAKKGEAKGVHGLAIDLISFDSKFRVVFSNIFGRTIVVDDIDTARRLGIGNCRMVSLDGDLCETTGAMIGGYRERRAGFGEKGLLEQIKKLENKVKELDEQVGLAEKSRLSKQDDIAKLRENKASLEGEIIKTEKSLHLDSSDLEASKTYKKELQERIKQVGKELSAIEEEASAQVQVLTQLKIDRQNLKNKIVEFRNPRVVAELNAFEGKRRELSDEQIKLDTELKSTEARISELGNAGGEQSEGIMSAMAHEMEEARSEIKNLGAQMAGLTKDLKAKEKAQAEFQSKFRELYENRNKISDDITITETKIDAFETESRQEELSLNSVSIEEARISAELGALVADYSQYEGVELLPEKSEEQLKKEIADFEKIMQDIGSVNMKALEIYDIAENEFNVLVDKKKTLAQEKDDVVRMMNEIENNKASLFMATLNVIEKNFSRIFSSLTSKGEAHLVVEQPENPFEGGVDIEVKLTGTKFLDIRSLSGGEKTLTALALIFAIQEHEPASFYVLDEVDAALDRANSEQLSKLIRNYSSRAQYLMISHNDAIISEASILYGVSMNEHGMSSVVSLKV
jgi:chromosome segregation protein